MTRLARALALVATVVVMLAAGVAVVERVRGPAPVGVEQSGDDVTRLVRGEGGSFEVPVDRWTVRREAEVLYYSGVDGAPLVAIGGPAVHDDGYCPGSGPSNRAFAGFVRSTSGERPAVVSRRTTADFVAGLRLGARRPGHVRSRTVTWRTELRDGTRAVRSRARLWLGPAGRCRPERVVVDVVSFVPRPGSTTPGVVAWALVRDVGPRSLDGPTVEKVVATLTAASVAR